MRTEFLCFSVLRVTSGPMVKLTGRKNALNPSVVYSTDRSKAVVLPLTLCCFVFILRGDLFYVLPCVILFLCFSVLLALRLPRLGKRKLVLALFVRLFDLHFFGFFSVPHGVWEGLRFVIVVLPELSSYLYLCVCIFVNWDGNTDLHS